MNPNHRNYQPQPPVNDIARVGTFADAHDPLYDSLDVVDDNIFERTPRPTPFAPQNYQMKGGGHDDQYKVGYRERTN
jgi:hypothetical protein